MDEPAATAYRFGAIILAGGAGRRLGGRAKPGVPVGGLTLLERVIAAVPDAVARVVVGPPVDASLPPDVRFARESPAGTGPVAATAAGFDQLLAGARPPARPAPPEFVALLAADLPFLDRGAIGALLGAAADPGVDVALYVDDTGRRQLLCAVWRSRALWDRLSGIEAPAGAPLRGLYAGACVAELTSPGTTCPPWFDCDTDDDLATAEGWINGDAR